MKNFTEDDVELAERYLAVLKEIESLTGDANFTEDDVELAERHLRNLATISEATSSH